MPTSPATARIDKRTFIVSGAFIIQFMTIGMLFSYGLFLESFEQAFGWSRTLLSTAMSVAMLASGVLAFLGGFLSDRFGPRVVLMVTGLLGGTGYALLSQVTQPWQLFVIFGLLIGAGLATHDVVTLSTIARHFHNRRGIMTAVVKVGTATGQMTVPPISAWLIIVYGWQQALIMLGGTGAVVLILAALLVRSPESKKLSDKALDETSGKTEAKSISLPGTNFKDARRTPTFWMLCAIQFTFFATLTTIPLHIVVHGTDLGMTPTLAATLLSVMGGASIIGRLSVGTLVDRIGGRRALALCFVPLIASLAGLTVIATPSLLFAIIAVYGVAHGGFFTVTSPNVAQYFGLKAHGVIFGFILACGTLGGGVGPILAGWIFDTTGSYSPAFTTLAVLAALGLTLALKLPVAGAHAEN